jgi:GWxTD domain-containing protein
MDAYGFYFVQKDTSLQEGFTLFCFNKNFPDISNYNEMIAPLRYLTMRNEFEQLTANKDPKSAVDAYWLGLSGNTERARELIRSYYGRVQTANKLFTSYVEGWKSDRGMIYIIFGPPNSVMHNVNGEIWTYGEANNFRSLVFSFSKIENKYSDNDLMLERNPIYKDEWMRAVDIWRQGRVFNPH